MLIKSSLRSNYRRKVAITRRKYSQKFPKEKKKATNNKNKEEVLVRRKLQENKEKMFKKKFTKNKLKIKEKMSMSWMSKKKI